MDIIVSALISALVGFGCAYYISHKWLMADDFKGAFYIRMLLVVSIGMGLTGLVQQFLMNPMIGLSPDADKAAKYLIVNIVFIPLMLFVIKFIIGAVLGGGSKDESHIGRIESAKNFSRNQGNDYQRGSIIQPDENKIWAAALADFENRRDEGLYAKLFARNKGDENRIKAEYIEQKFEELNEKERIKKLSAAERLKYDPKRKGESSAANIRMGAYETKKIRNIDYLILANGNVAIKTPSGYRIYDTESSAIKSIDYKLSSNMFLTKGLLEVISIEDLNQDKNACPRCGTKNAAKSSTCRKCSLDLRVSGSSNKWVADANCPNCNVEIWSRAEECWSCGANFGRTSSYKPIMK